MMLQQLSEAIGVSGQEDAVRKLVLEAIADHAEQIRIDPMGSVTAVKPGTDGAQRPRVMLAAHMDEVGFMVSGFDADGMIQFVPVGGIDPRIMPALRVVVGDARLPGVVTWVPIHMNREQKVVPLKTLRIDIGAKSKDEAMGKVKVGERIAFSSQFVQLSETMVRGKAFDDRVGVSLLIDLLREGPYAVDLHAAFTVQEEIGLRGAKVAAQTIQPDAAFVLEGTTAHDLPDPEADPDSPDAQPNPACYVGRGPVVTVMDRSMIVDPRLLAYVKQTAQTQHIPYQLKTALGGGTDGGAIHQTNAGVPTAVISVPCRYIHSPAALLSTEDYAHTLALLKALLNGFDESVLAR